MFFGLALLDFEMLFRFYEDGEKFIVQFNMKLINNKSLEKSQLIRF